MPNQTVDMPSLRVTIPLPKTWWAKQITDSLYSAGRLTNDQFKYACESGFKSVLSLHHIKDAGSIGSELLPTSEQMATTARKIDIHYEYIIPAGEPWSSIDALSKVAAVLEKAPRPLLLHCEDSLASSFCLLAYISLQTRKDAESKPTMDAKELCRRFHSIGFNINDLPILGELLKQITNESVDNFPPPLPISNYQWYQKYWLARPVYKNTYTIGQLRPNYFPMLLDLNIKVIFNLRYGMEWHGKPDQEEVTLLNIRCYTGTYEEGGRQRKKRLQDTRIFSDISNDYISSSSQINYQTENELEFGDDVGYNETIMKREIQKNLPGVKYIHTPCELFGKLTVANAWDPYKEEWLSLNPYENILFVCRVGYRATVAALLLEGYVHKKSSEWAIQRAYDLGYQLKEANKKDVITLFQQVLDS